VPARGVASFRALWTFTCFFLPARLRRLVSELRNDRSFSRSRLRPPKCLVSRLGCVTEGMGMCRGFFRRSGPEYAFPVFFPLLAFLSVLGPIFPGRRPTGSRLFGSHMLVPSRCYFGLFFFA